ncbi:MAG: pentapeptide repeat-containing protein, partial [bacterium]|nr:pentapeptide repeat-containing protein [bacterium]
MHSKKNKIPLKPIRILDESDISSIASTHTLKNPADFSNCDISSNSLLKGLDLTGALFTFADCFELSLEGCTLTNCDFTGALYLRWANFDKCIMDRKTADTIRAGGGHLRQSVTL